LLPGIPLFCIVIRYNLVAGNICPRWVANIIANVLPWIFSIPVYTGTSLMTVINWTSLIVNGWLNFVIPFLLYILIQKRPPDPEINKFYDIKEQPICESIWQHYDYDSVPISYDEKEKKSITDLHNITESDLKLSSNSEPLVLDPELVIFDKNRLRLESNSEQVLIEQIELENIDSKGGDNVFEKNENYLL